MLHLIAHSILRIIPHNFLKYITYIAFFWAIIFAFLALNSQFKMEDRIDKLSELPAQINNLPGDTFYRTNLKSLISTDFERVSTYDGKKSSELISYGLNQNDQLFILIYSEKYQPDLNKDIIVSANTKKISDDELIKIYEKYQDLRPLGKNKLPILEYSTDIAFQVQKSSNWFSTSVALTIAFFSWLKFNRNPKKRQAIQNNTPIEKIL